MSRMDELNKQRIEIEAEQQLIRDNCKHDGELRRYGEPVYNPTKNVMVTIYDCMICRVMQLVESPHDNTI